MSNYEMSTNKISMGLTFQFKLSGTSGLRSSCERVIVVLLLVAISNGYSSKYARPCNMLRFYPDANSVNTRWILFQTRFISSCEISSKITHVPQSTCL
jgi:hypothetical protein